MSDFRGSVFEEVFADFFGESAEAIGARVGVVCVDEVTVEEGGVDGTLAEFLKLFSVEDMIEMAVGQDEGIDIREAEAVGVQGSGKAWEAAEEARVDQMDLMIGQDEMLSNQGRGDSDDFSHRGRVCGWLRRKTPKKRTMGAF